MEKDQSSDVVTLRIADEDMWDKLPEGGGVYEVVAILNGGIAVRVPRILGDDAAGTLYIGSTANFRQRIPDLKKSLPIGAYKGSGHGFGVAYRSNPLFEERYPVESLHVRLFPTELYITTEAARLIEYVKEYGELPPFNERFESIPASVEDPTTHEMRHSRS